MEMWTVNILRGLPVGESGVALYACSVQAPYYVVGIHIRQLDSKMDSLAQSHQLWSCLVLIATGPGGRLDLAQYS